MSWEYALSNSNLTSAGSVCDSKYTQNNKSVTFHLKIIFESKTNVLKAETEHWIDIAIKKNY